MKGKFKASQKKYQKTEVRVVNDILMSNREIFSGEEISELTVQIINEFAERKLSVDKARIVLDKARELVGEYSIINPINS